MCLSAIHVFVIESKLLSYVLGQHIAAISGQHADHQNPPAPTSRSGAQSSNYLGLPNRRSLSTFRCALMVAATFRTRWVVIVRSNSLRGACKRGADRGLLSVRSGWCSWKFSICHTSQHFGQRPSAKHSILPHNVVRHRPWRGSRCVRPTLPGLSPPVIGPGQMGRTGHRLADSAAGMVCSCKEVALGHYWTRR